MQRLLLPEPQLRTRLIILAVLLLPVLLAFRTSIVVRLLSCIVPLILTGTYRISRVKGDRFFTRFHLAFIPLSKSRCNLPAVVAIHTTYKHASTGIWTFILFGPVQWVFGYIFDYLIPALGGPYEIWLETAKGREILAWNGYNQKHFEANLELLRNRSNAEVHLR